jgi:hypothetical protein
MKSGLGSDSSVLYYNGITHSGENESQVCGSGHFPGVFSSENFEVSDSLV